MALEAYLKWLPVVDVALCTGCGECIKVCGPCSLQLVDNLSVLTNPGTCGSEEHCIPVCPDTCIQMQWVLCDADRSQGVWRPA